MKCRGPQRLKYLLLQSPVARHPKRFAKKLTKLDSQIMEIKRIVRLPVWPTMEINTFKMTKNICMKKYRIFFFKYLRITPEHTFAVKLRYLIISGWKEAVENNKHPLDTKWNCLTGEREYERKEDSVNILRKEKEYTLLQQCVILPPPTQPLLIVSTVFMNF